MRQLVVRVVRARIDVCFRQDRIVDAISKATAMLNGKSVSSNTALAFLSVRSV